MNNTEETDQKEIQKLLPFLSTFLDLVTLYSKNLNLKGNDKGQENSKNIEAFKGKSISFSLSFIEKQRSLCLEVSWSNFEGLMKIFFSQKENTEYLDEYTKFCLAFIVYGTISYDNTSQAIEYNLDTKVIDPKHIVDFYLIQDLGNNLKLSLLSMIIANLNKTKSGEIFELVLEKCDIKEIFEILQNARENKNFDEK